MGADVGMWVVRSASTTVYVVDLDQMRVVRRRGAGSVAFAFDGAWLTLISVSALDPDGGDAETGVLRVGRRGYYLTDPGGFVDYQWRVQRTATAIDRIRESDAGRLRQDPLDALD